MAAVIVDNDVVRDTVLAEFPGGEARALITRPGLADPDVDRDGLIVGAVDRGESGAPVDGGEPSGIAMRTTSNRPEPPLCSQATAINPVPRAMLFSLFFAAK
jgi:cobalamin biosynthesis protein CbiD